MCNLRLLQAAAVRLAEHWKQRKAIFGASKAFEPMSINGALSEDLDTLKRGNMMILPSNSSGQAVLFFNGAPSESFPRNSVVS